MPRLHLKARTDHGDIDRALADVVTLLVQRFPAQLRSIYLLGSWAYGDVRPTSDIDAVAVFRPDTSREVEREAEAAVDAYGAEHRLPIGLFSAVEGRIRCLARVQLKQSALLLYGDDIRPEIELPTPIAWAREQMHGMYLVTGFSRGLEVMDLPLDYLAPDDEFFGLATERAQDGNGNRRPGTRDLVTGAGWYASALLAWRTSVILVRKVDVPDAYATHLGGDWAPFLHDLFASCRDRWSYAIPADPADRQHLRELCRRSLDFENHFLSSYRDFVLGELSSTDEEVRGSAMRTLERLPYRDEEIERLLYH